jgi:O-antigen/teichoic acid export membrane protein
MAEVITSSKRSALLRKNILASFFLKAWSAIVVLLMVPVTLHCLGEYKNGVWLTISSLLIWIDNMDIGLGNGMRNNLATLLAKDDTEGCRSLISSTFAMLISIMLPTALVLVGLIAGCDTYQFLNVSRQEISDLDNILITSVILVCSTFIFKLIGNFYMGLQLPAVSNLLLAIGQTLALLITYFIYISGSHSLYLIALANTLAPLVVYLGAYPYTFFYKYPHLRPSMRLVDINKAKSVMTLGIKFFIMQVSGIILFMSSNILISKLFSPALVTPYQITYRYFSLFLVVFTIVCMPYWNATTDAYARGDIDWIRNATSRLRRMTVYILIGMAVMLVLSNYIYSIWVGPDVDIDFQMSAMMALYIFILIYSMRYSYFINGIGKLRLQLIFTSAAAILFIPVAYIVVRLTDSIICFMAVMCIINIPSLVINKLQFHKLISGKAKGIWNK